jgi:YebC/PmpR family DNA-binding regulatory protein
MGRHNTIAGRMASSSAAKGRLFTKLAREIMVSARVGSDINANAPLRAAVTKAKDNSMPKENIERAIKKGSGEMTGLNFEEITYEGYGPNGSAIMIEVLTDNRNRTHPELRRIFQKNGGTLGEMGVVAWMFKKRGVFIIDSEKATEDKIIEIALDAGAEDIFSEDNYITVYTEIIHFASVREALINAEIPFEKAGLEFIPDNLISLSGDNAKIALELIDKLEENDDVQNVYHNFDIQE